MIHFDISKLIDEPRRSGIQRVERALIRDWPNRDALVPCRFDPASARLRRLPREILDVLVADAPRGGAAAERALLAPFLTEPGPIVPEGVRLLCAELFDDPARAAYHLHQAADASWLVYDFLPWLHPEWFPAGPAVRLMPFLQAMRGVGRRAFISAATRRDAERLFRRPESGPLLSLGADGLGLERQRFDPARRDIVMLGTIEARKNLAPALHACRRLWDEGVDLRLTLIGAIEPDALAEQALLRELADEPRLVVHGPLSDAAVRTALRHARVLLFPSEGEGYGLPPVEALHAGIPVIAAASLPALGTVPPLGQLRLGQVTPSEIEAALRAVGDDATAQRLWHEAAQLSLPSWRDFARSAADWVG